MAPSRSPSRSRNRSASRSPPRSVDSPSPAGRRRRYDSRSLSRSRSRSRSRSVSISRSRSRSRSLSRSRSRSLTPPRRNGRHRSSSRDSRSPSDSPPRYTKIVVERLSKNVNEEHLFEIFGQFGPIYDLDLPMNRTFGTNRGTAYILYDHHADAEAAIEHMHEAQIDGSIINVSVSTQRSKLSPEPRMARRNANMNSRAPFHGARGRGPPSGPQGGRRYGPRSDVYRPNPLSPGRSRSPRGAPPSRGGAGRRYRSRSHGSYSSRSRSRSRSPLPRRRGGGGGAGRYDDYGARRRSRSLSRSRSRSRSRSYDSERSDSRSRGRNYR
ncbi:hypothetical protein HDV57DRAFT_461235 [Trichoderma longibrachiatum]|uniref:RNA-binding domain-containing protein n=1 Tax=Trichoderma longibrachiatum ATCC 18648 TaxID=983965 RepID=A0A2T4C5D5_TRILO|nr:RNA-binding domain-containing protein [Trichoderma longibrachiatum ATCC 18648]